MKKVIKGRSSYQIILWYKSKTLLFLIFWKTAKKCQTHSKFQEINDCIFFVIDKDEMLSCMEPEALKNMTNFKIHTQCLGFLIKYMGLEK